MKPIAKLDVVDKEILRIIQKNSRITIKDMAQRLNLSTTPIFDRIKRMERSGLIKEYVAIINPKILGLNLHAFIHITIKDHSQVEVEKFIKYVCDFDEITECHHITGDSDFILKAVVIDIEAYNNLISVRLANAPNISKVRSSFTLSSPKKTSAYPIHD